MASNVWEATSEVLWQRIGITEIEILEKVSDSYSPQKPETEESTVNKCLRTGPAEYSNVLSISSCNLLSTDNLADESSGAVCFPEAWQNPADGNVNQTAMTLWVLFPAEAFWWTKVRLEPHVWLSARILSRGILQAHEQRLGRLPP